MKNLGSESGFRIRIDLKCWIHRSRYALRSMQIKKFLAFIGSGSEKKSFQIRHTANSYGSKDKRIMCPDKHQLHYEAEQDRVKEWQTEEKRVSLGEINVLTLTLYLRAVSHSGMSLLLHFWQLHRFSSRLSTTFFWHLSIYRV